jgi:exoribonuclease R
VPDATALAAGLARIRAEHDVPASFPDDVAASALAATPRPPVTDRADRRDLPMVTLDPRGSRDLDQAFALQRRTAGGWTVFYAIADVGAYVVDGGPVDVEARARGVTLYLPDGRAPLHPPTLSEGSASLLPGVDRPCVLWRIDVDAAGLPLDVAVERAVVRSRAQLDYPAVQRRVDAGEVDADGPEALLVEAGTALAAAEEARGGVSLPLPEQIVERRPDGRFGLGWRSPLAVESWNAQLSLLTGRAAAELMLTAGMGLLRTLPPFDAVVVARLRRAGEALGVAWPPGEPATAYPAFVRSLDPATATGAALLNQAARVMRGADYVAFGADAGPAPEGHDARHAAVAAPYAHVTAPLRRLADRFAAEVALAAATGGTVPAWAADALPVVPELMATARQRESAVSRAVVDLAEALVLGSRLGEVLPAVVVGTDPERGSDLQLLDPPVRARMAAPVDLGSAVDVRVVAADPVARRVSLEPA